MNDLSALIPLLAAALVDFLWQGAVIGLLAWLALSLLRHARPQARYAVACVALLACVLVPAWQLVQAVAATTAMVHPSSFVPGTNLDTAVALNPVVLRLDTSPSWLTIPDDALPWIVALWAAGAGILALRMTCGLWWVRRLRAGSLSDHDGFQQRLALLARRLGIRRAVALRIVTDGESPLSIGWWKPVVLLPAALALHMPTHLLEALLAHELAHIRRHDYLVNLLQGVVEVLLFYHPVTWWLSRRIRIEREQVADDIAASVLGEPRRLAIALSQLERYAATPFPSFAQAAHGGQLMSRIQQLVRPNRRAIGTIGSIVALPLLGLAAAGLVFAQVHTTPIAPPAPPSTAAPEVPPVPAPPAPLPAPAPPAAPSVLGLRPAPPAPPAPPAARFAASATNAPVPPELPPAPPLPPVAPRAPTATPPPAPRPAPAAAPRPATRPITHISSRVDGNGYALVRKGREGFSMSGDADDIDEIRATRRKVDGDFLWFRRDGAPYIVRDAELLQRAEAAWAPTQKIESRMRGLEGRMRPHQVKLDALGKRMEALHVDSEFDKPETKAAIDRMEALGERMQAVAQRQLALTQRMQSADQTDQASLQQQAEALAAQQERLGAEMAQHSRVMDAAARRMDAQSVPMEALAREMEAASKPMESVGREMEVLGKQIEQQAALADARIGKLIDEAVSRNLAAPAPARQ